MAKIGFDNDKYLELQSKNIKDRIAQFGGKLYLEFGGKLFDDYHASRVLPGFQPDSKVRMLYELREDAEIVIVISAEDIEKNKRRGDLGITYDMDCLRLIDAFRDFGLFVGSVCITHFTEQPAAVQFKKRLEKLGMKVYKHYIIPEYPANVPLIVSDDGFGKNDFIETERSLVVITAPGPGSGKMATCLSQLYHEHKHGVRAGYAKFETFPIWNLPLKHPVNVAYEAATADLNDVNMIDPFHLEAYNQTTVNYNRDVEIFPVLNAILTKITGDSVYRSPTDMGVNMAGFCIVDDGVVSDASKQEVIRRYYESACLAKQGLGETAVVHRIELLMNQLNISVEDRRPVQAALDKAAQTGAPATAIELEDGTLITGKTSALLGAASAMLINVVKNLAGIPDGIPLLSPSVIEPIQDLKVHTMGNHNPRLHVDEVLIALSICAATNPVAKKALEQLPKLRGLQAHATVMLSNVDIQTFKKLGVQMTCEPVSQNKKLYHK
ncbi:MAG: DUF1846 domain-containing protein [Clostridia bacterium]|nr:DUF1846 domain-containing protein [Clostridia bacterium]